MKRIRKLTTAFLVIALLVTSLVSVPALAEEDGIVHRIAGASRYLTAVEVSEEAYDEAETVIIAAGANFPDALAASALAGKLKAPILLAEQDGFRAGTLEEIERLGATKAIVLGGEKALGAEVVDALEDAELKVTRIAGENRYETATLIAKEVLKSSTGKEVFLVNGDEPWDALAIGPVAADKKIPVLLTKAGALRDETKAFLVDNGIKSVIILGGEKAVSAAARNQIPAGISVQRVYGASREATALEIAKKYFPEPTSLVVASRTKFADALVGGYFGGKIEAPIVLVYEDEIRDIVDEYLWKNHEGIDEIFVLGGEAVVSKAVADELDTYGVVTSLEAIPGQIIEQGKSLKFKVNGKLELDAAGFYSYFGDPAVTFLYDAEGDGITGDNGVTIGVGEGEYAVTYGTGPNKITTDYVPFEVAKGDAFAKVTEFVLVKSDAPDAEEVKAIVWGDNLTDYRVKALKGVRVDGKPWKVTSDPSTALPTFEKWIGSSNEDVIKINGNSLVLQGLGDTALSFTFDGYDAIYHLYVKVEAGPRAAKSIANKNVKAFTYANKTFDFTAKPYVPIVLDQYGDVIDDYEPYVKITKGRNFTVEGTAVNNAVAGMTDATTYTVTVYTKDPAPTVGGVKLGSYTITTVKGEAKDLKYGLEFVNLDPDDDEDPIDELDRNVLDRVGKLYLGITYSIKGVEVTAAELALASITPITATLDSSNPKVAGAVAGTSEEEGLIVVTPAVGPTAINGTTAIKLTTTDGSKVVTLASKNVTVVDTTPALTLKLAKGIKKLQVKVVEKTVGGVTIETWAIVDIDELVAPELEAYDIYVIDPATMIESVTFHGGDTPYAVVKVAKEFGGKSFTFDAVLVEAD